MVNQNLSNGREPKKDRVVQRCCTIYQSQDRALKEAEINLSGKIQWMIDTFILGPEIAIQFQPNAERIFISETENIKDYLRKFGEEKTIDYVRKLLDTRLGIPVTLNQAKSFWEKWMHLVT